MRIKILQIVLVAILSCGKLCAQNNTSPYSILGIGDVETNSYGKWSGMGSTGVALYSNRYLNQSNPASLSKLDDQFFTAELTGRYKTVGYAQLSTGVNSVRSADISMERLAIGIKLTKKWGTSAGLMPFSTSNYSFSAPKPVVGTAFNLNGYYSGSGGLNEVYWSNAYSITKNLRAGIQLGYLFGSLQQTEQLSSDISSDVYTTTRNIYMTNPYITYGLQYNGMLSKKVELAMGATYAAKTKLDAQYSYSVVDGTTTVVADQLVSTGDYNIPSTAVGGLALTFDKRLIFAADYRHQDWSRLNYKGLNYALVNSDRYSAGFEMDKHLKGNANYVRFYYQAGVFYNNSYLQINQEQLKDFGATIGFGLNSIRNPLGFSTSLMVGSRGTTANGLIRENYTQINFTISYRDFWFTKGRKYE